MGLDNPDFCSHPFSRSYIKPEPGNLPSASEGSIEWVQIRRSWKRNTNEIQWQCV